MEQAENSTIPTQDTMDSQPDENGNKEAKQTLAESLEILKSYDPKSHYAVDSYIDAQDSFSSWRVGKILEINNDFLKINFDGWSHKWDEVRIMSFVQDLRTICQNFKDLRPKI